MDNSVVINGTRYVPEQATGEIRIVVLQRGWVVVGRYSKDGDQVTLRDAAVIRIWGTSKGLPEIADGGPTSKTVLDKASGPIQFHALTEVFSLSCNQEKWNGKL